MFKKNFWIILFLLFFPFNVFAYDNLTTHPALTSEIVKFYNNFYSSKITEEEKQRIIEGSIKEDEPLTRTLNHFYDPVYQKGLSGEINAGAFTPFLKILKPFIKNAKEWAQNSYAQANFLGEAYRNALLNPYAQITKNAVDILSVHTWEKAIYNYILGNKKQAFEDLGHVLHLLEDMGVPAHTRNDHHLTGDDYEKYASQFTPQNINVTAQLKDRTPLIFNSLNEYFNDLAVYTNSHFYSQDTIGVQSGYNQPEWNYLETKIIDHQIYSINQDEFGNYFLIRKIADDSLLVTILSHITLNDSLIYSDYWSHLSKKVVLSGAGVLRLFFEEVERYKNDKDFLNRMKKTLIMTIIENFKRIFGNLGGENYDNLNVDEKTDQAVLNYNNEQANQIIISSNPVIYPEINKEITVNSASEPTYLPTALPTPLSTLATTIIPTPIILSASPSPIFTPTPTPFFYSSNNSTPTPTPTLTPTPTPTFTLTPTPPPLKILISEILYDASQGDSGKEFIELYNPNETEVDLTGLSLRIVKNNSTTSNSLVLIKSTDSKSRISANGFFLIGFNNYDSSNYNNITADITRTYSLPDPKEEDFYTIRLINKEGEIIDEISYDKNIGIPGKSLERKANASSTIKSMTIGDDRFKGNGFDTDSMSDFIIRDPQPQNTLSLSEPRSNLFVPINIQFHFNEANNFIVSFELTDITQNKRHLKFELLKSYSAEEIQNSSDSIKVFPLEIITYDWTNNKFEGQIKNFAAPFYFALRSIDEEGMFSLPSEIILVESSQEEIKNSPIVFYNSDDRTSNYNFHLSNWYGQSSFSFVFTSQNEGYLKNISVLSQSLNCALSVGLVISEVNDDNLPGNILGRAKNIVFLNSYWNPNFFTWEFNDGEVALQTNKKYAVLFSIESAPNGNCHANFYGSSQLLMRVEGFKAYPKDLFQIFGNLPLIEGETIFKGDVSIGARLLSFNNLPLKLQLELRPKHNNFDDKIKKGDLYFFESNYVPSGEIAEINVSDLSDNTYHWRVRAVDLFGYASPWYYYGLDDNSDFYVDADQSDYPVDTLYALAPRSIFSTNTTEWGNTMYGPSLIFSTFLTHQSGYVDRIELPAYYLYCSFPIHTYIYSVSPNQAIGTPDQLLASSLEASNARSFDGYFGILSWRFDRPVFLEQHRYYALKLDFSDVNTGTASCSVFYRAHPDIMSSRIYLPTNDGWQLKTENDLNFVVYKYFEQQSPEEENKNQDENPISQIDTNQ